MGTYILHLGSNVGDRSAMLAEGLKYIRQEVGQITLESHIYETEPWGIESQHPFLNMAIEVTSTLKPLELLTCVKDIEVKVGRTLTSKWGPRILDIDIIFNEDLVMNTDELTIPHPHLQNRNFVLIPLMEIIGDFEHPILHKAIEELYIESEDKCEVWEYDSPN